MKRFIAVQHSYSEFLGTVEKQLENRGIGFTYYRPFTGQSLPATALQFDALWLLGGTHAPWDREHTTWLEEELRLVRAFERARRPVVGIGFGALLLAQAAGGTPATEAAPYAYWTTARATAAGAADPLAQAIDGRQVLVAASGRVRLPEGVEPLAVDAGGDWIAWRRDHAYALLLRPELTPGMIEDTIMEEDRPLPDDISEVLQQARGLWPEFRETTDRVIAALVTGLDLMQERRKPPVFSIRVVQD
ncbi:MAG: type 1 glutamine amidotransferase [Burkholderiales bacterium]